MQNDTIIKALSEKIERLEAENDNLKTPPIEKALNTVFGINPDSIVDFSPKDLSLSNHYMLLSIEGLNELKAENERQFEWNFEWNQENVKKIKELEKMVWDSDLENMRLKAENKELRAYKEANTVAVKLDTKQVEELLQEAKHNVFALKDKNERLEKWDKEHREKIEELEKDNETFKQTISEKDAIIEESSKKWQSAAWQILIAKTGKAPQWKNSVKDGMPVFDSDPVAVITICGGIMATHSTLEEEDMEAINNLDDDFYYFLIPRVNATN